MHAWQETESLKRNVAEALAMYQTAIPASEHVIMIHLMGHLVDQMEQFGPLRGTWMFGLESFLGSLKGAVKNRAMVSMNEL
jgi:hypothetical protein